MKISDLQEWDVVRVSGGAFRHLEGTVAAVYRPDADDPHWGFKLWPHDRDGTLKFLEFDVTGLELLGRDEPCA